MPHPVSPRIVAGPWTPPDRRLLHVACAHHNGPGGPPAPLFVGRHRACCGQRTQRLQAVLSPPKSVKHFNSFPAVLSMFRHCQA
eukprot:15483049-Alexandrium_andersonii.AAC.1